MNDLRTKNVDLAERLEKAVLYRNEVREARAKIEEAEKGNAEAVKAEAASE